MCKRILFKSLKLNKKDIGKVSEFSSLEIRKKKYKKKKYKKRKRKERKLSKEGEDLAHCPSM
jgi:hypothetical protein